jgi:adenosine/AMP kinase
MKRTRQLGRDLALSANMELKLVAISKPDGYSPRGVEDEAAARARHDLLREIGYKR